MERASRLRCNVFIYPIHLNPHPVVYSAIIALIVRALESPEVSEANIQGFIRFIRVVCTSIASIFAFFGIGILYTLDLLVTDDAYVAIILKEIGGTQIATGGFLTTVVTGPIAMAGALVVIGTGATVFLIGSHMETEWEVRGATYPNSSRSQSGQGEIVAVNRIAKTTRYVLSVIIDKLSFYLFYYFTI